MISKESETKLETTAISLEDQPTLHCTVFAYRFQDRYYPGDVAVLIVKTAPVQPNQVVYRHRHFQKKGSIHTYSTLRQIGRTDRNGVFFNVVPLPNDSSIFGDYRDKYCVGSSSGCCSLELSFTVCPQGELQFETIPQETNPEVPEIL